MTTQREAVHEDAVAPRPRQKLLVVLAIKLICVVIAVGTGLVTLGMLTMLPALVESGISHGEIAYLLLCTVEIVANVAIAWNFDLFIWSIAIRSEIFSRRQSERLIVLGYLHAFLVVFGLLHIEYAPPTSMFAWFQAADVRPELDLRLLMFSAMFFALAGVFEYGRMLKQDSSSIV